MKPAEYLESMILEGGPCRFGEVLLRRCSETGSFLACHQRDEETVPEKLDRLQTRSQVREMARYCPNGTYRPLKTAPTLRDGWVIREGDRDDFYALVDSIYPAAFATTIRYRNGEIGVVPLRETLERQGGMNRDARKVTDQEANQIMRETCAKGCLRIIAWPIDAACPVSRLTQPYGRRIPLVCTEACTFVVSEAQAMGREEQAP